MIKRVMVINYMFSAAVVCWNLHWKWLKWLSYLKKSIDFDKKRVEAEFQWKKNWNTISGDDYWENQEKSKSFNWSFKLRSVFFPSLHLWISETRSCQLTQCHLFRKVWSRLLQNGAIKSILICNFRYSKQKLLCWCNQNNVLQTHCHNT